MIIFFKKLYWNWYYYHNYNLVPHRKELEYLTDIVTFETYSRLQPHERRILYLYLDQSCSLEEVGTIMDVTRERIRAILCKIRRKLKASLK
jgi:RNA polymerase sigma factor (sigma-70 family)